MNQFSRSIALWLALGLMFLLLFNMFSRQQVKEPEEIFSDFLNQVEKGEVSKVTIQGSTIHVVVNGEHYKTYAPQDPDLVKTLRAKNIQIEAKPSEGDPWWMVLLVQWFPMLLLVGVWIFFMRQMQIGGGKAMSFGKSRAKLLTENTHKVTFADVAGIDEAK
ncbi:MAG TPA: ATP-dependent metallopeptidase FtsH/Yme1/Tma family protein, partial [Candidatus Binataceae bacterium]